MDPAEAVVQIKAHFDDAQKSMATVIDKQREEIATLGKSREETATELAKHAALFEDIQAHLKDAQSAVKDLETKAARLNGGPGAEPPKSVGSQFIETDSYKNYVKDFVGRSAPMTLKTLFTGASLGNFPGYLFQPQMVQDWIRSPDRPTRVRSLFNVIPTSVGAIEFIRETGFTNAAAPVAEGNNAKPESALAFEIETATVKTIAHWLPVTRQILSDAPALEGYINARLLTGLSLVEDAQILYGDGTGANLLGIMNTPDIQTYNIADSAVATDTKLDAIRRAILLARLAEYPVSGVVLNPTDWADIELLKGEDGHYIWGTVPSGGEMRVWRTQVVETTALNPGEALTGAFDLAAALWDREQADVRISDSHSDYFIKNLWAILAEERIALTVFRPEAFVKIEFETS